MTAAADRKAERKAAQQRRRRQPLKATPEALERSALYYLERYDSASGHLRRLLARKVALSARVHGTDPEEGRAAVERLITRLTASGVLDDGRFARARARSLLARGTSAAMVRARLAGKGVPAELIEAVLAERAEEAGDSELRAALRYARRRRLGPFRTIGSPEERPERRARDLAVLGRQGFAYETARRVIDCDDPAALEAEVDHE